MLRRLETSELRPEHQRDPEERWPFPSDNYRAGPAESPRYPPEVAQVVPEPTVQQRYAEQRQLLTHYLKEYLNELTRSPDSHLVVQQLMQQQPQAQELMQQWLQEQRLLYSQGPQAVLGIPREPNLPGGLFPHLPGQQSHLQKLVEQYQRLQKQTSSDTQAPSQAAGQLPLSQPPAVADSQLNLSSDVDTFNIVITKNLTGGQSQPSVQYLPDAQVSARRPTLDRWAAWPWPVSSCLL